MVLPGSRRTAVPVRYRGREGHERSLYRESQYSSRPYAHSKGLTVLCDARVMSGGTEGVGGGRVFGCEGILASLSSGRPRMRSSVVDCGVDGLTVLARAALVIRLVADEQSRALVKKLKRWRTS